MNNANCWDCDKFTARYTSTTELLVGLFDEKNSVTFTKVLAVMDSYLQRIMVTLRLENGFSDHSKLPNNGCYILAVAMHHHSKNTTTLGTWAMVFRNILCFSMKHNPCLSWWTSERTISGGIQKGRRREKFWRRKRFIFWSTLCLLDMSTYNRL